jgi:hypothetical protein
MSLTTEEKNLACRLLREYWGRMHAETELLDHLGSTQEGIITKYINSQKAVAESAINKINRL